MVTSEKRGELILFGPTQLPLLFPTFAHLSSTGASVSSPHPQLVLFV